MVNTAIEIQQTPKRERANRGGDSVRLGQMGQRTINSTFLFRASNRSVGDCNENGETKKGAGVSLSDFLNKKLHKSSVLPTSTKGKEVAFSSPVSGHDLDKGGARKAEGEANATVSLDGVFQMFKNVENDHTDSHARTELESFGGLNDLQQTRKRKTRVEGPDHKPSARKVLAVLGGDSKPIHNKRMRNFGCKEGESKPLFNHYKSGCGWWDENMEGVDNKEVGSNEVWEGVGSTTLGGLEWH